MFMLEELSRVVDQKLASLALEGDRAAREGERADEAPHFFLFVRRNLMLGQAGDGDRVFGTGSVIMNESACDTSRADRALLWIARISRAAIIASMTQFVIADALGGLVEGRARPHDLGRGAEPDSARISQMGG